MDKHDLGYEYTISLCSAIEQFTKKEEGANPSVFIYKGSNLKFAAERAMYLKYINDAGLFEVFSSIKRNNIGNRIIVKDYMERDLISVMCNVPIDKIMIAGKRFPPKTRNWIRNIFGFLIWFTFLGKLAEIIRKSINKVRLRNVQVQVLFCIDRAKFARYLKPISSQIKKPFVYITHDKGTAKYLRDKKMPCIKIWSGFYFLERLTKKRDLLYELVLTERYELLFNSIMTLKPKSVVIAEGNAPHDEITNRICKKLDIECICIQQGWSPIIHNGFRNMSYSKMLVWGNGFAKLLESSNKEEKFITTGSHNIKVTDQDKRINGEKISIVFFIQEKSRLLSEGGLLIFVNLINRIAKELVSVKVVVAGKGGYQITEKIKKIKGVEIVSKAAEVPLQDILNMGDMIVSAYSTVILESIAMGKLPIILNITSMPRYFPDVDSMNAGIEVKNSDEAFGVIKKFTQNQAEIDKFREPMENFTKEYFYGNKDSALQNIVREIIN